MSDARWRPAYIGIGSNLDAPEAQVSAAMDQLADLDRTVLTHRSSLYRSAPLGDVEQPEFINAVAAVVTQLEPHELLAALQGIEDARGRDRSVERWGPRVIDLDLLALDNLVLDDDSLTIPHPGIAGRNFVLLPWAEIAPEFRVPGLKSVARLAGEAPADPRIERLEQ
jgi:2-amino-4-hydroxy-6-hydroxymethyldihydropteridine diphosphokinase